MERDFCCVLRGGFSLFIPPSLKLQKITAVLFFSGEYERVDSVALAASGLLEYGSKCPTLSFL